MRGAALAVFASLAFACSEGAVHDSLLSDSKGLENKVVAQGSAHAAALGEPAGRDSWQIVARPLAAVLDFDRQPAGAASLAQTSSVVLTARLSGGKGSLPLALELRGPGGFTYQRTEVAVDAEPIGESVFELRVPVAGSAIEQRGLAGHWEAYLLHLGEPIATTSFTL